MKCVLFNQLLPNQDHVFKITFARSPKRSSCSLISFGCGNGEVQCVTQADRRNHIGWQRLSIPARTASQDQQRTAGPSEECLQLADIGGVGSL
jgi:hypothetical protein